VACRGMVWWAIIEHGEPWPGFSEGEGSLAQGRGLNEGEPDPDFDGSELSYGSSGAPSMVKSGYDKMLNRVVVPMPSSSSGFPIGEGCETGISISSSSPGNDSRKCLLK
jgi:hypothetical protein